MTARTAGRGPRTKGKTANPRRPTEPRSRKTQKPRTSGGGRPSKGARASRRSRPGGTVRKRLLKIPKGQDVCAAVVVVGERAGNRADEVSGACEMAVAIPTRSSDRGAKAPVGGRKRARRARPLSAATCQTVAAASHVVRARILTKLLEGPAVYRSLQRVTKLKAGPLYHHVNQLRLAGLIMPKQRDLYELTRGGRNLILALTAVAPVIRDRRPRPQPKERD